MLALAALSVAASPWLACSGRPASGALQVRVELEPGLVSRCVRVVVTPAGDGARVQSPGITLAGKTPPLIVGVASDGLVDPLQVQAVGYSDEGCATQTMPAETSEVATASFGDGVTVVTVTLRAHAPDAGTDAGVDEDNDTWFTPDDCDDTDPAINPGATELCDDQVDNDCSGQTDCEQASCAGQQCRAAGSSCGAGACREVACNDGQDNDGDTLLDCADPDCAGQACSATGQCVGTTCIAPTETGLCFDGLDNDGDSLVDCADPDCTPGSQCSDGDACTVGDVCAGDGGCAPTSSVMCQSPPNAFCHQPAGQCLPDAGGACAYTVRLGDACDAGSLCHLGKTCAADGACTGTPVVCDTRPGECFAASGSCEEASGACRYAPLAAGPCSDGDNCTVGDGCDGDGGCVGTPVNCAAAEQCFVRAGCSADGGCLYDVTPGLACDAGVAMRPGSCSDAGTCVVPPLFPFTPSNFTEVQLPANAGAMTFNCGTTTLDTSTADGGIGWTNNCSGNPTPAFSLVPVGSQTAVLLFVESLTVSGTLKAIGARPLIIASRTTANVSGTIDVGSTRTVAGAGSDQDCGAAFGTAGSTGTASSLNNGGGGGGGAFGRAGGAGGNGYNGVAGGGGGTVVGTPTSVPLRGGCRGGHGGRQAGTAGVRGLGGGAFQLTAGGALTVTGAGRVTAYGGGGSGGTTSSGNAIGGGGGGSGGGLLLEGATVGVASGGALTANGGSGGQGGGITANGANGTDGRPDSSAAATTGDDGCGGLGGAGSAGSAVAGGGGAEECSSNGGSGGGGGGGTGVIVVKAGTSCSLHGSAIISPAARGNGATGCPAP